MNPPWRKGILAAVALLVFGPVLACHKGEQAVEGMAKSAETAEHKAQATATERDKERAALDLIPVPTKSRYVDVHDPSQWQNPFLTVGAARLDLRIELPDEPLGSFAEGSMLRPPGARRQELQMRFSDLGKAVSDIPSGAWHYGRVIAVAESPEAGRQDRARIRRNMESVISELNDLGVVVEEWPGQ
ncbi:MAG: hypothetical protein ACRD25_03400 [Terracidiphilus sp.]